eukprot:scaffold253993_cov37-Tisochrysis_lutea.AAC.4
MGGHEGFKGQYEGAHQQSSAQSAISWAKLVAPVASKLCNTPPHAPRERGGDRPPRAARPPSLRSSEKKWQKNSWPSLTTKVLASKKDGGSFLFLPLPTPKPWGRRARVCTDDRGSIVAIGQSGRDHHGCCRQPVRGCEVIALCGQGGCGREGRLEYWPPRKPSVASKAIN